MRGRKIAFFTPSLNIGGIERVFMTYANSLINSYKIDYVVCYEKGDIKQYLNQDINCIVLHTRLLYSLFKLVGYIRNYKPDYIITGGDMPNAMVIMANQISGSKSKVIISQHNYLNAEQKIYLSRFAYRFIYNYAHKIIAVSKGIASFLKEVNIDDDKIVTIYNPINIQAIHRLSAEPNEKPVHSNYILYVGRLSEVKNLGFLIQSFALLKRERTGLNLIIAGNGPKRRTLELLVEKLGIKESVSFLGAVANPYPLIASSLVVVLPSFSEALPTILLECFALGKTFVGTPTMGALELSMNGNYGFVSTQFNDEQEFSKLIGRAMDTPVPIEEVREYACLFDILFKTIEIEHCLA